MFCSNAYHIPVEDVYKRQSLPSGVVDDGIFGMLSIISFIFDLQSRIFSSITFMRSLIPCISFIFDKVSLFSFLRVAILWAVSYTHLDVYKRQVLSQFPSSFG